MSERVVASSSSTETPEDLLERIKRENPLIYDTVRTFIPEGWVDAPRMAALITTLAVNLVEAYGPVPGGKAAIITVYGGSTAVLEASIDLTLGNEDGEITSHDIARSVTEAVVGQLAGFGIAAGVAAIGITGVGGVALAVGLTAGAMALLGQGYNIYIDPYSKTEKSIDDQYFSATTVLSFADYFTFRWDDLSGFDEWKILSEKSKTEISYIGSEKTYQFSTPQIDEKTFYRILERESGEFGVVWDGAGSPVTDTVFNYYHETAEELKINVEASGHVRLRVRPARLQDSVNVSVDLVCPCNHHLQGDAAQTSGQQHSAKRHAGSP